MIDWKDLAKKFQYDSPAKMIRHMYHKLGYSMDFMAEILHVSDGSIRNKILSLKIPTRKRGGANYKKIDVVITQETYMKYKQKEICKMFGISTTTLYNRVRGYPLKYPSKSHKGGNWRSRQQGRRPTNAKENYRSFDRT